MASEILTKYEKRKLHESRLLERLQKQKNKPQFLGYLFFFIFVITMVYMVDEIATNIGKFLEIDVLVAFFGNEAAADPGVSSERALVNTLIAVIAGCAMFLRPLADRFGRKPFLVIYTFGMGIAMMIIALSQQIPGWVVGTLLIQMCIPHDMQQVYIQECVPSKKRGTYFFGIKGTATLSLMIVPLLRTVLTVDEDIRFRYVYMIVGVIGIVAAILALIFMRESDVYLDSKIAYLKMSDEERNEAKLQKKDKAKQGGIISGLIYCFKHKQLRSLVIAMCCIMFAYVLTENYNSIIGCERLLAQGLEISSSNYKLVRNITNNSTLVYPIACGLFILAPSFISDRIGRKKSAIVFAISALTCYVLFYVGCTNLWNPYVLGVLIGAACGSVWSCGDLVLLMVTESSGTNMRVSANACALLLAGIVYTLGNTIVSSLATVFGSDHYLGLISIIIVVIGLASGLVLLFTTVKETTGTDLRNVETD